MYRKTVSAIILMFLFASIVTLLPRLARSETLPSENTKHPSPVWGHNFGMPFKDGGTIYLYYWTGGGSIGVASSGDGVTFVSQGIVMTPSPTGYDDGGCFNAAVWKEGTTYYMIYTGAELGGPSNWGCLATASSPIGPWTKYQGNPVLTSNNSSDWDYHDIETSDVIKVGNTYYLWYNTLNTWSHTTRRIGLAISTNLTSWTRDPNNPIFDSGVPNPTRHSHYGRYIMSVCKLGKAYYGALTFWNEDTNPVCEVYRDSEPTFYSSSRTYIGVALHTSGLATSWDGVELDNTMWLKTSVDGTVYSDSNGVWMYYNGKDNADNWSVGLSFARWLGTHKLVITEVEPLKTVVGQGYVLPFNVTVANTGDYDEEFNVTFHANATVTSPNFTLSTATTQTVTLANGNFTTISFTWNTTGFFGNYTISADTSLLLGENSTTNTGCFGSTVTVTIPGDINGDFKVDLLDLVLLANSYGSKPGNSNWNPNADINGNGLVDLADLVILVQHYGQHYP